MSSGMPLVAGHSASLRAYGNANSGLDADRVIPVRDVFAAARGWQSRRVSRSAVPTRPHAELPAPNGGNGIAIPACAYPPRRRRRDGARPAAAMGVVSLEGGKTGQGGAKSDLQAC
jgi:hypothetical protein